MKLKTICIIACCFLGSTLVLGKFAVAQQPAAGQPQTFPQPTPEKM